MRVLIAGCGYVGSELARQLLAAGHQVHGLRRDASQLPAGVGAVAADLHDPASWPRFPSVDALVFAASPAGRTVEAYERTYLEAPRRLLEALEAAGSPVHRAVLTSSTAVYGQKDGSTVDETSETEPDAPTARVLVRGERAFLEAHAGAVVVRLAGIYGPGRTRMVRQVAFGEVPDAPDSSIGNRMHRDDCAGAIAHVLALATPARVYVGVDDAPVPLGEVRDFIASRLGIERKRWQGDVGSERGHKRLSNARLRASGYELRVPTYREGYPPIVEELLREHPGLASRR